MLNFLNHFSVPGVEHVMIYHDDADPNLFYMVPEQPSVMRRDDGVPSFTLISFARDFKLLADAASALPTAETEGGLLQLTTSLEVTKEDQEKIRTYIQGGMGAHRPFRPIFIGRRMELARITRPRQVKLAYPTWYDGNVAFHLFPEGGSTFVKSLNGSEKPSLVASNLASYSALLGQEGLRLVRNSIEDGWSPGTINYDVSFVARIPNLTITVKGNSRDVYEEIKRHSTITETYRSGNRTSTYRYPQVSSLEEMQDLFTGLTITYDKGDFRGGGGEDPTSAIETAVFAIVQQLITTKFLAAGFQPGLLADKLGTDPLAHGDGEKMPAGNQLWLKDFKQSMEQEIDFSFTGTTSFTVEKHPNSELFATISPDEVKNSIIEADLSTPYFSLLDVPVQVTADFDRDPIAAIKVFLDYDEIDEKNANTRKRQTEEFLFDSNEDKFYFRTVMARNADGTPKDEYTYRSQIIYKASARSTDLAPVKTRDRNLIIGYDQLNCVNVEAYWGAIPADAVQQVQITFRYPGLDSPSANAQVLLRLDSPTASWFTYTGENSSNEYEYQVTFFMSDGSLVELPAETTSSQRLIINAPFEDKLTTTFVPQGAFPPVSSIVVTTKYTDGDYDVNDVHSFHSPAESWQWEVDLRDRQVRQFQYRVDVTFADGSSESGDWQEGAEGTILVGDVAREMLDVEVVADLIDMSKWKLVIVRLRYSDPANSLSLDKTIKLTAVPPLPDDLRWTIPLKDAGLRTFTYQVQAFAHDGTKHIIDPTPTDDPLVLLEF